jgi:hypothetical protein
MYSKLFFQLETPKIENPGNFSTVRFTDELYGFENAF